MSEKFTFYDGREKSIGFQRMEELETSLFIRLMKEKEDDYPVVFEKLGSCIIDYTNVNEWVEDIPDVDPKSARLFIVWAENTSTKRLVGIVRGYFLLLPLTLTRIAVEEYYKYQDGTLMYPMAVISSIKTSIQDENDLDIFLNDLRENISQNWKKIRQEIIRRLPKGSNLWKRYIFSFDKVIHFTFHCPVIDQEVIESLQRNNYRMTGLIQLLASTTPFYDEATVLEHVKSAKNELTKVK